jgi:DNA phosphorothioation-associated putative methyltransferase
MSRNKPSFLAKLLVGMIEDKELNKPELILDWGCGRGDDIRYYKEHGLAALGWDPHYESVIMASKGTKFDIVTCAYVLNVIDNPEDRVDTLREAKKFLRRRGHILVCARSHSEIEYQAATNKWKRMSDGYITGSGTFQVGLSNDDLAFALNFAGFEILDVKVVSKTSWALGRKK